MAMSAVGAACGEREKRALCVAVGVGVSCAAPLAPCLRTTSGQVCWRVEAVHAREELIARLAR